MIQAQHIHIIFIVDSFSINFGIFLNFGKLSLDDSYKNNSYKNVGMQSINVQY